MVLWVPITSHCAWENFASLQIFQCATEAGQDADCEGDGCAQIESVSYRVADTQTSVPFPPVTVWLRLSLLDLLPQPQPWSVTAAPAEIPIGWQFFFRTALPPRAPSPVS